MKLLETVVELAPGEAMVHFHLGLVLEKIGNLSQAAVSFLRAQDLDPKDKSLIKDALSRVQSLDGNIAI